VGVAPTGDTLDGQRARGQRARWICSSSSSLRLAAVRVGRFVDSSVVYLESCIKNDLNLSGGLVLRVVTHSLIGLD